MAWFGPRERGTALGVRQMATPLGGALAALALPLAVVAGGVPAAFWVLAAACVVAAVACAAGLRRGRPSGAPGTAAASKERSPMRDRRLWRLATAGALIVAAQLSLISYLVLFLGGYRRLPLAAAALVLTACQFLGAGARVAAGAWSDRARERIAPMRRLALLGALLLVVVAAGATLPLTLLVPVMIACTVVNMSTNGLAFTATGELAGQERAGTAMGFQNTLLFISGAVAPIAFGAVVTAWGWRAGFLLIAASALAGWALLAPLVAEERKAWGRRAA